MSKGYFSLVQYCPDFARQEAVNVGVVLLCPEQDFVGVRMASANNRVRALFGEEADDYRNLNSMKRSLEERIRVEADDLKTFEAFQTFVQTRANRIILTSPKPMRVGNAGNDLAALFDELVTEPKKAVSVQAAQPLRQRLDAVLEAASLRPYLKKGVSIEMPKLKETLEVPYAYQNGRLQLIQPANFTQKFDARKTTQACRLAVEGRSIFEHRDPTYGDLQLNIVADFRDEDRDGPDKLRDILNDYPVHVYTKDQLNDLVTTIEAHGKPFV
jgi:hypothetical protein